MPQQPPISFWIRTKNVLILDGNEATQKVRAPRAEKPRSSRANCQKRHGSRVALGA